MKINSVIYKVIDIDQHFKKILPFSAQRQQISAFRSPAFWLYPLKPGGEQKSTDVRRKTVTLIYPDP